MNSISPQLALVIFIATLILAIILPDLTAAIMLGGALWVMLTGILTTQQAYQSVSWKTVFLVAGMLPMGIALTKTNAAALIANGVVASFGEFGAMGLLAGLFLVTVLMVQAVSGAVVAAVIRKRSVAKPKVSDIHRFHAVAPASQASSANSRHVTLLNRSPSRESPSYMSSAAMPSRSISAIRSTGSCSPCQPVECASWCSG